MFQYTNRESRVFSALLAADDDGSGGGGMTAEAEAGQLAEMAVSVRPCLSLTSH